MPAGWHLPGTVLLATDKEGDYSSAFERILKGELYGAVRLKTEPELVSINFWESGRGRELEQLFFAETLATGDVPEGAFFRSIRYLMVRLSTIQRHWRLVSRLLIKRMARASCRLLFIVLARRTWLQFLLFEPPTIYGFRCTNQ